MADDKTDPGFSVVIEESDRRLYRHDTPESADREARRLAAENPGKRFYVLHAAVAYERVDPVRRIGIDVDRFIPF